MRERATSKTTLVVRVPEHAEALPNAHVSLQSERQLSVECWLNIGWVAEQSIAENAHVVQVLQTTAT